MAFEWEVNLFFFIKCTYILQQPNILQKLSETNIEQL